MEAKDGGKLYFRLRKADHIAFTNQSQALDVRENSLKKGNTLLNENSIISS